MQGFIVTLKVDGSQQVTKLDRATTLDDLQTAIGGGSIEIVPRFNAFRFEGNYLECVAFCDEEGKIKNFPINKYATMKWAILLEREYSEMPDYLAGDIAVVFGDAEFIEAL